MRAIAVLTLLLASGCSALLPGPSEDIPCALREDGSDPCAELARVCAPDGFCRGREVCNASDDDGDGTIDEGPESDADGDQFTWCGSGVAALADCDDTDPGVHPADPARGISAPTEVCDGRDNQCDGDYDAIEASGCSGAQRCSRTEARCVDPLCTYPEFQCPTDFQCVEGVCRAGSCVTSGCPPTEVCDPVTRACVEPAALGASCATDAECETQRCYPIREALGITVGAASGVTRVCGRACCDDRDCPADFACWASGTGARSCVARSLLAAGSQGAPEASERACSDAVACEPMQCLPTTYSAYDRERLGFVCGATTRTDSAVCRTNDQCESGICLFGHGPSWDEFGACTGACRTSADCAGFEGGYNGSVDRSFWGEDRIQMGCVVARFVDTTEFVQVCLESTGAGADANCTTDVECLDRGCVGGTCRATCCGDGDCSGGDICRPFASGDRWEMHCAPPLIAF